MRRTISRARTKRELIITAWDDLGRIRVGASELRKIQSSIHDEFGAGAVESPAVIARVLADAGAELRHPEVIEFDARWRHAKIKGEAKRFRGFEPFVAGGPLRLKQAEAFIKRLAEVRDRSEHAGDKDTLQRARKIAVDARQVVESLAKNPALDQLTRTEQAEIVEWLAVWLQTPNLFREWLELRLRSPEFRNKFLTEKSK